MTMQPQPEFHHVAATPEPGRQFYTDQDYRFESGTLDDQPGVFQNPDLKESYGRAKKDAAAHKTHSFANVQDLISWLDSSPTP